MIKDYTCSDGAAPQNKWIMWRGFTNYKYMVKRSSAIK